ncbi:MAG: hypothetical protein H3C35_07360 [Bacteroidetes bacterium]|nr:hypothetical protein [Bacteroidota bacterium]
MTKKSFQPFLFFLLATPLFSQFNIEGDFQTRWYSDNFYNAMDNRAQENYLKYLGRIRGKSRVGQNAIFFTELTTMIDNPGSPVRNIGGTGAMRFGISQIFAEMTGQDFLIFDVARLRVGRQQFPIGNGLTLGDSYYFYDKFDGARIDLALYPFTLSMFGAVTGQNTSSTGIYPDPGSDQLYAARLGTNFLNQDIMAYFVQQKLRGAFNDNTVFGFGATGNLSVKDLDYFLEGAYQNFNTPPGLPEKGGIGYMGGISYRWGMGPFRSIKVETRYAAYQGDDAKTSKIEQFSPPYPNFWWGSRTGYVNGDIGGNYPNNKNLEGSRIWYSRIYFIPSVFPKVRVQFQYVKVGEYIDNDNYNSMNDEFSVRLYYTITRESSVQLRYSRLLPNGEDKDLNGNGVITSSEDRVGVNSYMVEWKIEF